MDYEKILKEALNNKSLPFEVTSWIEEQFPQLAESEGEKMRKRIILCLEECVHNDIIRDYEKEQCLAWLEKPKTEKVYLWFKVGDVVCSSNGTTLKIVGITDYCYNCITTDNNVYSFSFDIQDEFELVEDKKEWSKEDESYIRYLIECLEVCVKGTAIKMIPSTAQKYINWLKSLKNRYTCKPSDEQIKVCKEVYADILSAKGFDLGTVNSELNRLEEELKKLK